MGFKETFAYDGVNRITSATKDNLNTPMTMLYDVITNNRISNKSDIGDYNYFDPSNQKLSNISNLKTLFPRHDVTYTVDGKTSTITETNNGIINKTLNITYGLDNQRFKSEYTQDGSLKYTRFYFKTYEKEILADGTTRHLNYIYAGSSLIAIFEQKSTGDKLHYVYTDYLGSLRCITSDNGTIEQRLSYDVWGNRRAYDTGLKLTDSQLAAAISLTRRGFTGHEHLDELSLINMNGRVYDPGLGVFMSADNYVQQPTNSQNFNRYTYCLNNPLKYTDPSGEVFGIDDAIVMAVFMAYIGGTQANFMHCGNNSTNPFNPGNWDWSSGRTYTGIATGAISGAGMAGVNVFPTLPGAINGVLQAGINVGINGIGNVIDGTPFFQGAAIPAAMGLISGAISGYQMAHSVGANPLTGKGYLQGVLNKEDNYLMDKGDVCTSLKNRHLLVCSRENFNIAIENTGAEGIEFTKGSVQEIASSGDKFLEGITISTPKSDDVYILIYKNTIRSQFLGDVLVHENIHYVDYSHGLYLSKSEANINLMEIRALYYGNMLHGQTLEGFDRSMKILSSIPHSDQVINKSLIYQSLWE